MARRMLADEALGWSDWSATPATADDAADLDHGIKNALAGDVRQDRLHRFTVPFPVVPIGTWVADVLAILVASVLVDRVGGGIAGIGWRIDRILPTAVACFTAMAQVVGAYDVDSLLILKRSWPRVLNAWLATVLGLVAISHALDVRMPIPIDVATLWGAAGFTLIAGARMLLVPLARGLKRAGMFNGRTAIVGAGIQGMDLANYILRNDQLAVSMVGFFDDLPPPADLSGRMPLPYLGGLHDLIARIRAGQLDRVFIAISWGDEAKVRTIVNALAATPVEIRLSPDRAGFAYAKHPISSMGGLPIITLLEQPLSGGRRMLKAAEDHILALAALTLLAPLMMLVALAIKLDSRGPALFRQSREGFNCRPFSILKFRTMYADSCASDGVVQTRRGDARVTRIGRLLRRTSIDELPQLINVLLGHMSLVGPRPHAPSTRAGAKPFADVAASYAARHRVKPGLTGWAQISGWRGETNTEEKLLNRLEYDLYYVQNWSIWFDLYILARTAMMVLFQREAY